MFDIYSAVTDRIIMELEKGIIPWHRPWVSSGTDSAVSHVTGRPYSLLNQLLLNRPGEYLTFNQCKAEGGSVRKGEKSSMVVFWKWIDKTDDQGQIVLDENGKPEQVPFLRYYSVFHIDQCDGISPRYTSSAANLPDTASNDEAAEAIIRKYQQRSGVSITNLEGSKAYYQPSTDSIVIPLMKQFVNTSEYYSTLFHEAIHSTGHPSRLNRIKTVASFGSSDYSKEELVAEIGSAALVNHCQLETQSSFQNSAAYIQSWLSALRNDKKLIVSAAGKAEKAVSLILGE